MVSLCSWGIELLNDTPYAKIGTVKAAWPCMTVLPAFKEVKGQTEKSGSR